MGVWWEQLVNFAIRWFSRFAIAGATRNLVSRLTSEIRLEIYRAVSVCNGALVPAVGEVSSCTSIQNERGTWIIAEARVHYQFGN